MCMSNCFVCIKCHGQNRCVPVTVLCVLNGRHKVGVNVSSVSTINCQEENRFVNNYVVCIKR